MFRDAPFVIYRGSATTLRLELRDERDEPEDLASASAAHMSIASAPGQAALVSKEAAIDAPASAVSIDLTAEDTAALSLGIFLLDAIIDIPDVGGSNWYQTDPHYVRVCDPVTALP